MSAATRLARVSPHTFRRHGWRQTTTAHPGLTECYARHYDHDGLTTSSGPAYVTFRRPNTPSRVLGGVQYWTIWPGFIAPRGSRIERLLLRALERAS